MNTVLTKRNRQAICLAAFLAMGALAVWLVACVLVMSLLAQLSSHPYEQLIVTRDGQAYIHQSSIDETHVNTYRALDGKPLDISFFSPDSGPLYTVWLAAGENPASRPEVSWTQRVVGFLDNRVPATYWYFVHDGRQSGFAYFVGYDSRAKHVIGYLGRKGFSAGLPAQEEQFADVPIGGFAAQSAAWGREPDVGSATDQSVYVNSGGALLAVDLEQRSVRPIPLPGPVVALAMVDRRMARETIGEVAQGPRLAVRTSDQIVLLSMQAETPRSVPIPDALRDQSLAMYDCAGPAVILQAQDLAWRIQLYWIDEQGKVSRHEDVQLLPPGYGDPGNTSWMLPAFFPSPAVMVLGIFALGPQRYISSGQAPDYPTALAQMLGEAWGPLLVLCLASGLVAAFVYRRQKRFDSRGAAFWAVFVFLTGPLGLAGYWLHRRWPAREKCPKCGALAPRDRDECLACAEPFPLPALVGIEIFA